MIQDLKILSTKACRHFNHFLFLFICSERNVVPNGLKVHKTPCVGNMSEESKKKWEAEQHDTGMSFVSILKKENLNKSKTLQIQF